MVIPMFCPKCGNEITENQKFCGVCGANLHEQNIQQQNQIKQESNVRELQKICANCGSYNPQSQRICSSCGQDVNSHQPTTTTIENNDDNNNAMYACCCLLIIIIVIVAMML